MPEHPLILHIAIPRPLYSLFDYLPASNSTQEPRVGCRVRVPFGNTQVTGFIIELSTSSLHESLRPIDILLDSEPLLDEQTLKLLQWSSEYYHHPLGEVIQNAIPVALRGERKIPVNYCWQVDSKASDNSETLLSRSPKQLALYKAIALCTNGLMGSELKLGFGSGWRNLIKQLEQKQLITQQEVSTGFPSSSTTTVVDDSKLLTLTDEQSQCLEGIEKYCSAEKPKPILIHGITGSGKTEVYLRAMTATLYAQKQILILVPEIGLTPQLLSRFKAHFPQHHIAVLHSGLATVERMHAWLAAKSGQAHILIGTRSAVFSPMPKLGMIIIDEEHDSSLKQQEGFRYHARDLAVKRCYDQKIPILMGSATPSIESLHNVDLKRYHYLRLNKRPGASQSPTIALQDIRGLPLEAGISPPLLKEVKQHLHDGNQVMLFLNRRGFAPAIYCPQCGWHAQCPSCDSNMTYHSKQHRLICHHCDYNRPVDSSCPECSFAHITTKGQGTERIESVLQTHFPTTQLIRIDRDTTSRKGELAKKLAIIHEGNPAILIGTQMLAKGHDFPNLTLVGILDVDQSLFSTDFRAQERLAQLIIQVSGRAGRAHKKGKVILQSCQPEHPFFPILLSEGYLAIVKQSLCERKTWHFPPHAHQALIRANAEKQRNALAFLQSLRASVEPYQSLEVVLLGPAPSPQEKRADRYRVQLLITAEKRGQLHLIVKVLTERAGKTKKTGKVRWSVDIDPIDYS